MENDDNDNGNNDDISSKKHPQHPFEQICEDIKAYAKTCSQKFLERDIGHIQDIPIKDLDVLCRYFPVIFIAKMFGGNFQKTLKDYSYRMKAKAAKEIEDELPDFIELEPYGQCGWQYLDRMKIKVIQKLEDILNKGVQVAGHSQLVQASKTLLDLDDKSKKEASDVLLAYQAQLLLLAEHLVERFLPTLGVMIKNDLQKSRDDLLKRVSNGITTESNEEARAVWQHEIKRFIRNYNLKRFELLLAETMINNKEIAEALDFSKDLIDTYKQTDMVDRDSKSTVKLKEHIQNR